MKKKPKKKNPQDSTSRNLRAMKKDIEVMFVYFNAYIDDIYRELGKLKKKRKTK